MSKKVIVAGHICVDITPAIRGKKVDRIEELLVPGNLIDVGEATVSTGGAVANTGIAMKKLGADVSLLGKVGKDSFGDIIRNVLKEYDVHRDLMESGEHSTSYTVVLAVPGIDRIFLHNPGVNHAFYADDIPQEILDQAVLFHFGYPSLMRSMFENDGDELVKLMKRAREAGLVTSLDFASFDEASEAGQADWRKILTKALPYVDMFLPSIEELCFMLDRERYHAWQERAAGRDMTEVLDMEKDVRPLAAMCREMGAKFVLLKCGIQGMYFTAAPKEEIREMAGRLGIDAELWGGREIYEKSYVPDQVLSATGAGDTAIGAFLTAVLEGYDPEMTMHLASGTGACCIAAYDSFSGLKSFGELESRIRGGWEKLDL